MSTGGAEGLGWISEGSGVAEGIGVTAAVGCAGAAFPSRSVATGAAGCAVLIGVAAAVAGSWGDGVDRVTGAVVGGTDGIGAVEVVSVSRRGIDDWGVVDAGTTGVPRLVVMATESVMGGVALAGWGVIVICAVGGTSDNCGGAAEHFSAGGPAIGGGLSP